jgi:hypothetical protein
MTEETSKNVANHLARIKVGMLGILGNKPLKQTLILPAMNEQLDTLDDDENRECYVSWANFFGLIRIQKEVRLFRQICS